MMNDPARKQELAQALEEQAQLEEAFAKRKRGMILTKPCARSQFIHIHLLCVITLFFIDLEMRAQSLLVGMWKHYYARGQERLLLDLSAYARRSQSVRIKLLALHILWALLPDGTSRLNRLMPLDLFGCSPEPTDEAHMLRYVNTCVSMFGEKAVSKIDRIAKFAILLRKRERVGS